MATALDLLVEYSNRYGSDPGMVLAGGGNTSMKTDQTLYVKGSGTSLATITGDGFVVMSRRKLGEIWRRKYSEKQAVREAAVLEDMMVCPAKSRSVPPSKPFCTTSSPRNTFCTSIPPASTR